MEYSLYQLLHDIGLWRTRFRKLRRVILEEETAMHLNHANKSIPLSSSVAMGDFGSGSGLTGEKWITHYSSSHMILLVGEGDFSFSACLAKSFGSAHNMVATSIDSEDMLPTKHWSSVAHIQELEALGCTILHEVDVNDMHVHAALKYTKFDRIIFNFPHAGHDPSYCEWHGELFRRHKGLMKAFFASAVRMLSGHGEVHVNHRNDHPYIRWKIVKLAKKEGLALMEMAEFRKADYPGYHNKRGGGINSNKTFPLNECFTFKFSLDECGSRVDDLSLDLASCKL